MSLDELIGQELGAYTIEEPLGHGNMGKVYRARQGDAPRPVALKVIRRIPGLGHDLVARFQREKEAMSQLGHPNILPIYDYASNSDYLWIAMLLVHGGTLHEKLQRERLDLNEVKTYLGQLAWALDYAHTQGVIHRDIKPQNVLIDRQGKVYLTDFGIAKMLEQQGLTLPGATVGTPEYMSPEQVRGQPVEARSDQYSLGVLAYQMACGKVPFEGQMMQVMTQHAKADPPNPRKLNPDLPDGAARALLKALSKKPADRFETCTDFAEAFAEGLEGKAGGTRLPRYWWVAILLAVVLAAGAWKASRPGTVEGKKSPTPAVKAAKKPAPKRPRGK